MKKSKEDKIPDSYRLQLIGYKLRAISYLVQKQKDPDFLPDDIETVQYGFGKLLEGLARRIIRISERMHNPTVVENALEESD